VDQLRVSSMVLLKSTKLVAPFVHSSPQKTLTAIILPLFSSTSLNRSPGTNSQSSTPSLFWTGRFLQYLNSRHPSISFEFEENHEIPFLDVRIKRNLNTRTAHCKTTFTGLYTKWDSFTPRKYKNQPNPHPSLSLFTHLLEVLLIRVGTF